jgi:exosortase A
MTSLSHNPGIPVHAGVTPSWRPAMLVMGLLLAWVFFLYRDTGMSMVTIWERSETFAHGFLVPPIAMWLIWRQRQAIAAHSPQSAFWVLLPVAGVAFLWLLGELVSVNAVTQLGLVALVVLSVPAIFGLPVARQILFPLGFLFFAVPIGDFVMPQLMEWTADFTVFAVRLSGVPVYREGLQFVIPSGTWSVVEACSGVRYLIASITVGTLFAYLNYQSTKRRLLFILVSILVPIVANWLRAYMIVMLGHLSGNKLATGVDHLIYGWVFFGVVIMLMFLVGSRWSEPESIAAPPGSRAMAHLGSKGTARLWLASACFAAIAAMPHAALWAINQGESTAPVSLTPPPMLAAGWQVSASATKAFEPSFKNPSAAINSTYSNQGASVGMYLGYYRHQGYDRKLVSSSNVLVNSNDPQWAQVTTGSKNVVLGAKSVALHTAALRGAALSGGGSADRLVAWQVYWLNGTLTANDYLAKAYSAFYQLMGRGDDSAVIVIYTPEAQGGTAESTLESFLTENYAAINDLLLKVRRAR